MAREITYLVRALKVDQGARLNTDTPINALRSIVQRESAANFYDLDDIRGVSLSETAARHPPLGQPAARAIQAFASSLLANPSVV